MRKGCGREPAFTESQALDKGVSYVLTKATQDHCRYPVSQLGVGGCKKPPFPGTASGAQGF